MKKLSFAQTALYLAVSMAAAVPAHADNKTAVLKPEYVFTPKGFDSDDNAQVVVAGVFTGYCMKMGFVDHRVDLAKSEIYIDQSISITDPCVDLDMYIPYSNVVNIGSLPAGTYSVMTLNKDGTYSKQGTLPIVSAVYSQTGTGTDQELYAPISSVSFEVKQTAADPILTLDGIFTNTCLSLDSIQTKLVAGNVLEVLPVAVSSKTDCKAGITRFSKSISLKNFPAGETLIHVRSMNGQSINKVISNLDRLPH